MPVAVVNAPPTNTRESATANAATAPFTLGAHDVSASFESKAASRSRTDPPSIVNAPPTNVVCPESKIVDTSPSALRFQLLSEPPVRASEAMLSRLVAVPPAGVTEENFPPMRRSDDEASIVDTEPLTAGAQSRRVPTPSVPTRPSDERGFAAPTPPDIDVKCPPAYT